MRRRFSLLAALALIAMPTVGQEPPAATPEGEIGLAKGSVFDVLVPEALEMETAEPGDKPLLPREFEGSPPRVPHGVDDYLPVTRDDNLCVDCHAITEAAEGEPTPLPPSHYTDLRHAPQEVGEAVVGARWVCLSCHVPLTGAEPLVGNPSVASTGPVATDDP